MKNSKFRKHAHISIYRANIDGPTTLQPYVPPRCESWLSYQPLTLKRSSTTTSGQIDLVPTRKYLGSNWYLGVNRGENSECISSPHNNRGVRSTRGKAKWQRRSSGSRRASYAEEKKRRSSGSRSASYAEVKTVKTVKLSIYLSIYLFIYPNADPDNQLSSYANNKLVRQ